MQVAKAKGMVNNPAFITSSITLNMGEARDMIKVFQKLLKIVLRSKDQVKQDF